MDPDLSKLIRRATNLELPFSALPSIVELKRRLDDLEWRAIDGARAKGASWEDIAGALGITRQALQQRVRHRQETSDLRVFETEPS